MTLKEQIHQLRARIFAMHMRQKAVIDQLEATFLDMEADRLETLMVKEGAAESLDEEFDRENPPMFLKSRKAGVRKPARKTTRKIRNLEGRVVATATLAKPDSEKTVTDLVRETFGHFAEPFSKFEVVELLRKRYPEREVDFAGSNIDSCMNRMRTTGELQVAGERPGLSGRNVILHRPGKAA